MSTELSILSADDFVAEFYQSPTTSEAALEPAEEADCKCGPDCDCEDCTSPIFTLEDGKAFYHTNGRPDFNQAQSLAFMAGWLYEWGFTDSIEQEPPLFLYDYRYMQGYDQAAYQIAKFESAMPKVTEALEAELKKRGWWDVYIEDPSFLAESSVTVHGDTFDMQYLCQTVLEVFEPFLTIRAAFEEGALEPKITTLTQDISAPCTADPSLKKSKQPITIMETIVEEPQYSPE